MLVSTLAGAPAAGHVDGDGAHARFDRPIAVEADSEGGIYVVEENSGYIRQITTHGNRRTVVSHNMCSGCGAAALEDPSDLTVDSKGNVYVADGKSIIKIDAEGHISVIVLRAEDVEDSDFNLFAIAVDSSGRCVACRVSEWHPLWGAGRRAWGTGHGRGGQRSAQGTGHWLWGAEHRAQSVGKEGHRAQGTGHRTT